MNPDDTCPTCGWTWRQAWHIFGDSVRCPNRLHREFVARPPAEPERKVSES